MGDDRRLGGWRVGAILLLVALVPLAGTASVTWRVVSDARDVARSASSTTALADRAAGLTNLDGAVFDEMVWTAIAKIADSVGVPADLIANAVEADPQAELDAAIRRTNEIASAAGREDVLDQLAVARAVEPDMREVFTSYREIADTVEASLSAVIDELATSQAGSPNNDELERAAQVLELAISARASFSEEFYGYFATIFDLRDTPAVELERLIEARAEYGRSLAALGVPAASTPVLRAGLDTLNGSIARTGFMAAIDDLIDTTVTAGAPANAAPVSIATILVRADGFEAVYRGASESSENSAALLDGAVDGIVGAAQDMRADADANIRIAYLRAAALTLMSLIAAWLAARFIVRPLNALQRAAQALQGAPTTGQVALVGPTEVRAAAFAIRNAAQHLDLVTRQSRALASGDLDAAVLDEPAPGGLGTAVQHAVGTLRSALAQQDEFRRRLAHEASHDGLTQLANRNASMAQLTRSLARTARSGSELAVLFIDLDRFKDVNDHHGHPAGDAVLGVVAQRIVNNVREGDHVGRLGGDEFIVVAEPVRGVDEAVALAQRLVDALNAPIDVPVGSSHVSVTVGASIGIALTDAHELSADELLRDADLAVYRVKESGRGGIEVCNEDLRNEIAETAELSAAIRRAIDHDELVMHYQPIVDPGTGTLHSLEALVRWERDGQGLVPPDRFIPFAERSNLIVDIDRWVIDAVARQVAAWSTDAVYGGVDVAINVSRRHLADDHFVQHVLQPLAAHGVAPRSIVIEVTESALISDLDGAAIKLQQLRDHGLRVAIDDYGTGYTSLAHLRSLPVDILKIDRSFTAKAPTDEHEASLVKLIIDAGHLLGATITAEGIETALEADTLVALGSDSLQGFYFARPQPAELLTAGIADNWHHDTAAHTS